MNPTMTLSTISIHRQKFFRRKVVKGFRTFFPIRKLLPLGSLDDSLLRGSNLAFHDFCGKAKSGLQKSANPIEPRRTIQPLYAFHAAPGLATVEAIAPNSAACICPQGRRCSKDLRGFGETAPIAHETCIGSARQPALVKSAVECGSQPRQQSHALRMHARLARGIQAPWIARRVCTYRPRKPPKR